jgi:uncharacterized protein YjdB
MRRRARFTLALLLLLLLTACAAENQMVPQVKGSLEITVTGLPDTPAAILVSDSAGFRRAVTATTTLTNLAPGWYDITASNVVVSGATYMAATPSRAIEVPGSTTAAQDTVAYALAVSALTLTVSGLPDGTSANVTVTGPWGFSQVVTATTTLTSLAPGWYSITASPVLVSGAAYVATPPVFEIEVSASAVPAAASVTYAYASIPGSLALTLSGLPDGAIANVVVTGPYGFSQGVTATTTLTPLVPGPYSITASNVVVSGLVYVPTPPSATVDVAASATPAAAAVAYAQPAGLTVTPATAVLVVAPGALNPSVQLTATLQNVAGDGLVTWISDNAAVASVDATGLVTAVGTGTAHVTASSGGDSGTAFVAVGPPTALDGTWAFSMVGYSGTGGLCSARGTLLIAQATSDAVFTAVVNQSGSCGTAQSTRNWHYSFPAWLATTGSAAGGSISFQADACHYSATLFHVPADSLGGTAVCTHGREYFPGYFSIAGHWSAVKQSP